MEGGSLRGGGNHAQPASLLCPYSTPFTAPRPGHATAAGRHRGEKETSEGEGGSLRLAPGYWAVGAQAMTTGACNLQKYRTRSAPVAAVMCDVCDVRPTPFVHFAKVCIRGGVCVCVRAFLMCAIAWCVYGVCVCLLDVWCQCHRPEPAAASAKVVTGSSPLKKTKRQSSPLHSDAPAAAADAAAGPPAELPATTEPAAAGTSLIGTTRTE